MIHRAENGKLKVTIFRKPTHTDQYLSMDSRHPLQHKLGVIRTLEHRAKTLVTDPEDKVTELQTIKRVLGFCGYKRSHFAIANANKPPSRNTQDSPASSMKGFCHHTLCQRCIRGAETRDHQGWCWSSLQTT